MRIIKQGKNSTPLTGLHKGKCINCETIFEFDIDADTVCPLRESYVSLSSRDGVYRKITCPHCRYETDVETVLSKYRDRNGTVSDWAFTAFMTFCFAPIVLLVLAIILQANTI